MPTNDGSAAVGSAWQRIAGWIRAHYPGALEGGSPIEPPASAHELDTLETDTGVVLPNEFRALLLNANGMRPGDYLLPMRQTRPTNWRTLAIDEIRAEWQRLGDVAAGNPFGFDVQAEGPVKPLWWSPGWIPIADCGTGDRICVDTRPEREGTAGQLVLYVHDVPERRVLYPFLLAWLVEAAADLEGGAYEYEPGVGLRPKTVRDVDR